MINIGCVFYVIQKKVHRMLFRKKYVEWTKERKNGCDEQKTYYVIRRQGDYAGLFSYVLYVLEKCEQAEKSGWFPIVDMQSTINSYLYSHEVGKVNSWEYYFEQPCKEGLIKSKECKKVVFSDVKTLCKIGSVIFRDREELGKWSYYYEKYIHLNEETKEYIQRMYEKIIGTEDVVLGILARGTDYKAKPALHPIQPDPDTIIADAKNLMGAGAYNKIFLATEDKEIYQKFEKEFGNKLLSIECPRYSGTSRITQRNNCREKDKYIQGLDYLTTIYVLAKCDALLAGNTNGSIAAGLINAGKYKYVHIYSLGYYPE